ncbi:hypothetical protein LCGC14_1981090 [marine sediment metagenome]|uniref:Uncharacterized protein n=1 Tax=marine sediment metagenome TaxID=412755 RepID=A0A0F9F962_9ZZZZ
MSDTYKIVRRYINDLDRQDTIKSGLTLEQAQAHCSDPETSSKTCTTARMEAITLRNGWWFDTWTEE